MFEIWRLQYLLQIFYKYQIRDNDLKYFQMLIIITWPLSGMVVSPGWSNTTVTPKCQKPTRPIFNVPNSLFIGEKINLYLHLSR